MKVQRTLVGTFFLFLIISNQMITVASDSIGNTGMAMRISQTQVDQFKKAMERFFPHYLTLDAKLPTNYDYTLKTTFGLWNYVFHFTDIKYAPPDLDIRDTELIFNKELQQPMLKVNFPTLEHWKISSFLHIDSFIFPDNSEVILEFKNLDIKFNCVFDVNDMGYLKPIVYATDLKLGETTFYHENWFIQIFTFHLVKFTLVMIQTATYFFGEYIFSGMMEPILSTFLDYYQLFIVLPSAFDGQTSWDYFTIDWRQVGIPQIGDGFMDMFVHGETLYRGEGCGNSIEAQSMQLDDTKERSQLVMSSSAFACLLNQYAKSDIGRIDMNEERFNQLFRIEGFKFDSSSLSQYYKIFEEKVGPNEPMKLVMSFKDIDVQFGQNGADVILDYTICTSFQLDNEGNSELLYDELKMRTVANVNAESEILHIHLLEHKLIHNSRAQRSMAKRDSMKLTENEYQEFIEDYSLTLSEFRKWMNDVVLRGDKVTFPYHLDEFDTEIFFRPESMHILIDVRDNAAEFLEEEFWTDDDTDWADKNNE